MRRLQPSVTCWTCTYLTHARTDTRTVSACPPDKRSACSRLRTAYPWSDRSKNSGFIWSPSVGQEELHQGLGISVKVSVICEHFREPLTFTCDGESSTASRRHWLLPEVCRSRDGRKKNSPLCFCDPGSSTVDLLIYQTFCYAHQDLDHLDVDHYLLKVLGQDEYFNK